MEYKIFKYYFIHIPKTAGTFIQNVYCNKNSNNLINYIILKPDGEHPSCLNKEFIKQNCEYYWDTYLLEDASFLSSDIKFTIIRNPFDMLKSYFLSRWGDCDLGIKNKLPKKNFKELVKLYCSPDEIWHIPLLKKFLYNQLFDADGNCCCDYAIIYDNMKEGFEELFKLNGHSFEFENLKINETKNIKSYKEYYDNELIELVNKKCKLELEMFNYTFDGYQGNSYLIPIKNFKINWNII